MSDGLGSVSYNYDPLSRLTSESRYFNALGQTFTLSYQYNLANELTAISDPFGATLNYAYDSSARVNSVSGSGYSSVTQFAYGMQYRAWGGLKAATYDSMRSLGVSYNSRMNPTLFGVVGQYDTVGSEYQYYADGRISYSRDLTEGKFDRSYSYDHVARLTTSFSGSEARGGSTSDGPYRQTYDYDSWGNLTQRTGRDWSHNSAPVSFTYDTATNRNPQWQYDPEGNVTGQGTLHLRCKRPAGRNLANGWLCCN
jgi:YD repeat-containing protein